MVIGCNNEITDVKYSGFTITKIYACDGEVVYEKETPPFEGKYKLTLSDTSVVTGACNSVSSITVYDVGDYKNTCVIAEIGQCVSDIYTLAFQNFKVLREVVIPNSVTSIGQQAFELCSALTSVSIPSGVTRINDRTFSLCYALSSVTIPDSVTSIGNNAFYGCSGLTSVTIPSSVTRINDYAFEGCKGLQGITIERTTPPALGETNVFANTNNCPIYVPAESVNAYKNAYSFLNWTVYASRIQAIP